MGMRANQIAFLKTNYLSQIGGAKQDLALPIVETMLSDYAQAFIGKAVKNIEKNNNIGSGAMASDMTFRITQVGSSYEIQIGYPSSSKVADYYDYQNKGVAGVGKSIASPYSFKNLYPSRAMMTNILLWLRTAKNAIRNEKYSPISGLETKRKKLSKIVDKNDDLHSLAYAISVGIKKKGIKPTHFFDDAITATFNKDFIRIISKAMGADISLKIMQYGNNN